jgi:hypothetical protein
MSKIRAVVADDDKEMLGTIVSALAQELTSFGQSVTAKRRLRL